MPLQLGSMHTGHKKYYLYRLLSSAPISSLMLAYLSMLVREFTGIFAKKPFQSEKNPHQNQVFLEELLSRKNT